MNTPQDYIKSYLSTGTGVEGSLLIPKKIADSLVPAVDKALIPRTEAAYYFGPEAIPGSSIDVNLETPNSLDIREVAEGAEVPLDEVDYSSFNMKPRKYGVSIRITKEMMEDSQFPLLEGNIRFAGKRFADNENSLIISDALDNATNTVSGGAAFTIPNFTRALQYLEDEDYHATTIFVGPEVLNDLRNIDTFVEYQKVGNTDMVIKGFQGELYGCKVILVSKNAGMTTTTAYVIDNRFAYAIAEKRRLTMEMVELPTFDMKGVVLTQRFKARQVRAQAICKITTS
jgi:HK97 family phage major capsid protein